MTSDHAPMERQLMSEFALGLSVRDLDLLDERMRAALRATPAPRLWTMPGRSRAVLIALALCATVGVAAGGISLLEGLAHGDRALRVAWETGVKLGTTATSEGVTVTLERAYVDDQDITLFLTHGGYSYIADYDLGIDGVPNVGGSAAEGVPTEGGSASVLHARPQVGLGAQVAMDLVVHELVPSFVSGADLSAAIRGDWRFEFTVPNSGGSSWSGMQTATAGGITTTFTGLRVSPTTVTGDLGFEGRALGVTDDTWSAAGVVVHDGLVLPIGGGGGRDNAFTFQTDVGTSDWAGRWTVRIDEIYADSGGGAGVGSLLRITGPWTFQVDMPR